MEYLNELKKLINAELVASIQYRIYAEGLMGNENFDYIKAHCEEHSEEELRHYSELVTALMERGETPCFNMEEVIKDCNPPTFEIKSMDCEDARRFFIKTENDAVEAYQAFHEEIKDVDADLDDIILGILADEREHSLDFSRIEGKVVDIEESNRKRTEYDRLKERLHRHSQYRKSFNDFIKKLDN